MKFILYAVKLRLSERLLIFKKILELIGLSLLTVSIILFKMSTKRKRVLLFKIN